MPEEATGFGIVPRHLRGKLKALEIAMYVALSWRADDKGISWASQKTLAEDCGMSRASVQRSLDGLEDKGFVKRVPWANAKGATSNVYMLKIWASGAPDMSTIARKDGHPMSKKTKQSGGNPDPDPPDEGTNLGTPVPKQDSGSGVPHTDAHPRLTERQRKKNHKNETQSSPTPPRSVAPLPPSSGDDLPRKRYSGWFPTDAETKQVMDKLKRFPGPEYVNMAAERWSPTMEDAWFLTCEYIEFVQGKEGWHYSPDGWLKYIEGRMTERANRPRAAYAENGVPM